MIIRQEEQKDYEEVYQLVKEAFETAEESDGTEQDLVTALRNSESFVPELSLVAVEDGKIIGHILFSKIMIGGREELALAPLSVHPKWQRKGIGLALMAKGHEAAGKLGYDYAVVLGRYGIRAPFDVPDENFMAVRLNDQAENLNGVVQYDKAFGI